jgi:hypothetical protein
MNDINDTEAFTVSGKEDYIDKDNNPRCEDPSSDKVFAKKILRDDGSVRYTIKLDNRGKLYNPISIYGETKISSFLDRVCRSQNKYRDVNLKTFEMYIRFLKTKNIAWFNNAEREM